MSITLHPLFVYGTLKDEEICELLFKEKISSNPAILHNYSIKKSSDFFFIVSCDKSKIEGKVIYLTDKQLLIADQWEEIPFYSRKKIDIYVFQKKIQAWVYIRENVEGEDADVSQLCSIDRNELIKLVTSFNRQLEINTLPYSTAFHNYSIICYFYKNITNMDIPVTTFRGLRFTKPKEQTTLESVLNDIKSDKWKDRIAKCQVDLKNKDWLPVFTPTGSFNHRSIAGMEHYNGVICLDIDHVEDPEALKEKGRLLPWVHSIYVTPSGKGLKVIVRTTASPEVYKETEEKVAAMWLESTGSPRDNRCKDIARIQFISHDPLLYYNPISNIVEAALPIEIELFDDKTK